MNLQVAIHILVISRQQQFWDAVLNALGNIYHYHWKKIRLMLILVKLFLHMRGWQKDFLLSRSWSKFKLLETQTLRRLWKLIISTKVEKSRKAKERKENTKEKDEVLLAMVFHGAMDVVKENSRRANPKERKEMVRKDLVNPKENIKDKRVALLKDAIFVVTWGIGQRNAQIGQVSWETGEDIYGDDWRYQQQKQFGPSQQQQMNDQSSKVQRVQSQPRPSPPVRKPNSSPPHQASS